MSIMKFFSREHSNATLPFSRDFQAKVDDSARMCHFSTNTNGN